MIIWEGNKKEFGTSHSGPLIPEGAVLLRKMAAYAISYDPLSKVRFIIMSFAPAFPGIIPLITFIIAPITMKPVLTICMVLSFMGLISPAPDYMDIITVLRKAPKESYICDSPVGLYACIQGQKNL